MKGLNAACGWALAGALCVAAAQNARAAPLAALALAAADVPAPLQPWIPWVLHEHGELNCPILFNAVERRCVWSDRLRLEVDAAGGRFAGRFQVYAESWLALPGSAGRWPQEVRLGDVPAVVTERDGRPALYLPPGDYDISGKFLWTTLPESMQLPPESGLVELTVGGVAIASPALADDGQLWLRPQPGDGANAVGGDRLEVKVFRQIIDELPLQIVTHIDLDVAGEQREVTLSGALRPATVPMALESALPARLDSDGRLRLQLRPGRWQIRLTTRETAPVTELAFAAGPAPWPQEEIWAFAARTALRLVEIEGGTLIDPRQTSLPADWQGLPTYRLTSGESLKFIERRRGDPEPEPDTLALARRLWLDFDGRGYTINDSISGQMTRGWRLEAGSALTLGRAVLNGEPQFITTLDGTHRGVEVRRGRVELQADSRLDGDIHRLSAVGWAQDFDQVSATLNLPPGWRLWSADGVDNVPDTWLHRWTLLDIFLVLIAAVATLRLWHWRWAAVMLLALALIWHETWAPRQVWLHLLAAFALLRVLPSGRLRALAGVYRNGALIVLLGLAAAFMIQQLRVGLFPQLARAYETVGVDAMTRGVATAPAAPPMALEEAGQTQLQNGAPVPDRLSDDTRFDKALRGSAGQVGVTSAYDAQANVQTGPGLPDWSWNAVALDWSGPVAADQALVLTFLSPRVNLLLALARVVLLCLLIVLLIRESKAGLHWPRWTPPAASVTLLCAALAAIGMPAAVRAAIPDPALLEELERRLTLPPPCLPVCAVAPRLAVDVQGEELRMRLEVHAREASAVPLPARADQWLPEAVLLDGEPATALRRANGELWLALAAGTHEILLTGRLPARASFQLPLPLRPQRVEIAASGWTVEGVHPDGSSEPQLILTRIARADAGPEEALTPSTLPAFFRIERTLRLGLDWRVESRVVRLTPPGAGASLAIPLLPGESVISPDIRVAEGKVIASLGADQREFYWEGVLAASSGAITLAAPATTDWVETWRADISPLWHAAIGGIPVTHHQDRGGRWLPEWQPWPGETVTLRLSKPAGVPGQTLTIDRSSLRLAPGQRATDATLALTLRSSQGGQHTVSLPAGAELQSVSINGVPQPIRQEGDQATLPIVPGEQQVELSWRTPERQRVRLRTPPFALGSDSVNARISIVLPDDRWTLFTRGPRLGPAVQFWGVLIVIALAAFGLSRVRLTPLAFRHWLLLGIGLSQATVAGAIVVVGWLLVLGMRARLPPAASKARFNLTQIALVLLTIAALSLLFDAIRQGLLGLPDMQIAGNGSSAHELNWFQDRTGADYPQAEVISVSLWVYRGLMLAWALWLAFALLSWLRWAWRCYARDGVWRSVQWLGAGKRQAASNEGELQAS